MTTNWTVVLLLPRCLSRPIERENGICAVMSLFERIYNDYMAQDK